MVENKDPFLNYQIDNKYKILKLLGEGGFAKVYKAIDLLEGKNVAVKIFHRKLSEYENNVLDDWLRRKPQHEVEALSSIDHPNIVKFICTGKTSDDLLYIIMEYIDGHSLREVIAEGPMKDLSRFLSIISQVCSGINEVHQKKMYHRDIKPENIMLQIINNKEVIKIIDFGIVKIESPNSSIVTGNQTGPVVRSIGSPEYMPPEFLNKITNETPIQSSEEEIKLIKANDMYALGLVACALIGGQCPPSGYNLFPPEKLLEKAKDLEGAIKEVLKKATSIDPENRFLTPKDFLLAIEKVINTAKFNLSFRRLKEREFILSWDWPDNCNDLILERIIELPGGEERESISINLQRFIEAEARWHNTIPETIEKATITYLLKKQKEHLQQTIRIPYKFKRTQIMYTLFAPKQCKNKAHGCIHIDWEIKNIDSIIPSLILLASDRIILAEMFSEKDLKDIVLFDLKKAICNEEKSLNDEKCIELSGIIKWKEFFCKLVVEKEEEKHNLLILHPNVCNSISSNGDLEQIRFNQISPIKSYPIICPHCVSKLKVTKDGTCSECGQTLRKQVEFQPSGIIGFLGKVNRGKTHIMASLIYTLQNDPDDPVSSDFNVGMLSLSGDEDLQNLFVNRLPLKKTSEPKSLAYDLRIERRGELKLGYFGTLRKWLVSFKFNKGRGIINFLRSYSSTIRFHKNYFAVTLVFRDPPGEAFSNSNNSTKNHDDSLRHVTTSSGLIYVIDPLKILSIRKKLPIYMLIDPTKKELASLQENINSAIPSLGFDFCFRKPIDECIKIIKNKLNLQTDINLRKNTKNILNSLEDLMCRDIETQDEVFSKVLEQLKKSDGDKLVLPPMAVVLSKCDILQETGFFPENRFWSISQNYRIIEEMQRGYMEKKVYDDISGMVGAFLSKYLPSSYQLLKALSTEKAFRYAFFGVSATGCRLDETGRFAKEIQPWRIADPLLWLLSECGLIPRR